MPDGRTGRYRLWKACERFGILPPEIHSTFLENSNYNQASLMAFSSIRDSEEKSLVTEAVVTIMKAVR
jgi:hypothetical protein